MLEKKKEGKNNTLNINSKKNENSNPVSNKPNLTPNIPYKPSLHDKIKNEVNIQSNNGIKRSFLDKLEDR